MHWVSVVRRYGSILHGLVPYTRATAGYVGTPVSAGMESNWKYMREIANFRDFFTFKISYIPSGPFN